MDVTRFRSFAERYVIERASTFKGDTEMEDAWSAVERAKSIYKHIENVANVEDAKEHPYTEASGKPAPMTGAPTTAGQTSAVGVYARPPIGAKRGGLGTPVVNSQSWTGRKSP
jgi:hypothetical protein